MDNITTPAIPSCFLAFFSDPYSLFKNFIFYHSSGIRISPNMEGRTLMMKSKLKSVLTPQAI